jgi:hypothetical protein
VFLANSSKSIDALVTHLSPDYISFIVGAYLEPDTPVRIEIGNGGPVPYLDLIAHVTDAAPMDHGEWRCSCRWERRLTTEQLFVSRHQAFHAPRETR